MLTTVMFSLIPLMPGMREHIPLTMSLIFTPARSHVLHLSAGTRAFDIMGNELPARGAVVGESPIYVTGDSAEAVSGVFGSGENQSSK